jgi:hypothetical protein
MEVCKSDMMSCAIECQWQPSEAAFDVWPPKTERASLAGQATIFCPRSA